MSIDAPFSDDDDNSMADMLSGGEDSRTDRSVDFESMSDDLKAVLKKTLKDREITIVTECFGIGCHEKGLEEIGTEMGLTRERVRQIREKAIEKIRERQRPRTDEVSRIGATFFVGKIILPCDASRGAFSSVRCERCDRNEIKRESTYKAYVNRPCELATLHLTPYTLRFHLSTSPFWIFRSRQDDTIKQSRLVRLKLPNTP